MKKLRDIIESKDDDFENKPVHEHDCKHCVFMGHDAPIRRYEGNSNIVDMYIHYHPKERKYDSIIRRYGSNPGDYSSFTRNHAERMDKYQPVLNAEKRRRLKLN